MFVSFDDETCRAWTPQSPGDKLDEVRSVVSDYRFTNASLIVLTFMPDGVQLPTPSCGEPFLFSSLDHRGLVITPSARSACAYTSGFERSMFSRAPGSWGSMMGAMGSDGLEELLSLTVIARRGQMGPQDRALLPLSEAFPLRCF